MSEMPQKYQDIEINWMHGNDTGRTSMALYLFYRRGFDIVSFHSRVLPTSARRYCLLTIVKLISQQYMNGPAAHVQILTHSSNSRIELTFIHVVLCVAFYTQVLRFSDDSLAIHLRPYRTDSTCREVSQLLLSMCHRMST